MSLCTHGVQTGEGYECSSCLTSPTFAAQLDTHLQRLAAERTPSVALVEERTEENTQRCPNCAPGYDCERGIYTPVTPAEERTGVSDVGAAVLEEVAALRFDLRNGIGIERSERVTARLDRIEQWVRGEQR